MNAPSTSGQFLPEQVTSLTIPLISRAEFARLSGVSEGVVQGWIQKGYIPTYSIGKYTLINLALLNKLALDKAFS